MPRVSTFFGRVALVLFLATPALAAGPYIVTDLGILPGSFHRSEAYGINSQGQVAGMSRSDNTGVFPLHPFLWSPTTPNGTVGGLTDLTSGRFDSQQSSASGINSFGQVVGESTQGSGSFLWTPTSPNGGVGAMVDLGDLPGGDYYSRAYDINSRGQVVGYGDGDASLHAYLWSPDSPNGTAGSMVDIGVLPNLSDYSNATGINALGQVVGKSSSYTAGGHAFLWTPTSPNGSTGSMVDLGGLPDGYDNSEANEINSFGQVVGYASRVASVPKAFLWTPNTPNGPAGSMIDLGHLPDGDNSSFVYFDCVLFLI